MRLVLLVVLAGVLLGLSIRYVQTRKGGSYVVALCVLVAILGVLEGRWAYREHLYTQVARDLIGRDDVKVHCQRSLNYMADISGNLGYVPWPPDGSAPIHAYLRNDTCKDLSGFMAHRDSPDLDEVRAVHVLTHEAIHLGGQKDEARTECAAVQRNYDTAVALGATAAEATSLAERYWADIYPHTVSMYRSPECRRGGALDEGLPHAPWADDDTDNPPGGATGQAGSVGGRGQDARSQQPPVRSFVRTIP